MYKSNHVQHTFHTDVSFYDGTVTFLPVNIIGFIENFRSDRMRNRGVDGDAT